MAGCMRRDQLNDLRVENIEETTKNKNFVCLKNSIKSICYLLIFGACSFICQVTSTRSPSCTLLLVYLPSHYD